jgi:thiamine transport system permease protein
VLNFLKIGKKTHRKWSPDLLLIALPLAFLAYFYFQPLLATFRMAWQSGVENGLSADLWRRVAQPLGFTFWQAGLSTLLTFVVGIPAAYVFARFRFRGKALMRLLTTIPFIMPTVVVAAGFNALLGPKGWLNLLLLNLFDLEQAPIRILNTLGAILLAHVFYNTTVVIRVVGGAWSQMDPRMEQAARTLGASPWQVWRSLTLPLLRPALISALLLVFLFDFTSFAVVLLMGGPRFATLEVEIYTQALHMLNLPLAGLLSAIQLACTLLLTVVYAWFNRRRALALTPRDPAEVEKPPRGLGEKTLVSGMLAFMTALFVSPLASLVLRSFLQLDAVRGERGVVQSGFTLAYYQELFINRRQTLFYVPPVNALFNSLWFGFLTVLIALTLGFLAAQVLARQNRWTRLLDPILMLPLGTSAVTLGLGFILVFNKPPVDVRSFPLLIPIAHSLVALPFVVRILQPAISSIPPVYRQAAGVLGASPWRVWWRVDFPILLRAFVSAAIFAFTVSLGEFGATTFLSRPELPTIPVAIYRYLSQPGALNYGQALAMSTILMVICALSIGLVEKLRLPAMSDF